MNRDTFYQRAILAGILIVLVALLGCTCTRTHYEELDEEMAGKAALLEEILKQQTPEDTIRAVKLARKVVGDE